MTRPGFTLIDSILSMLLVALILVGALRMLGVSAHARRIEVAAGSDSAQLGLDLLGEIQQQAYQEPGTDVPGSGREDGEDTFNRSAWDDIDDYDGWVMSPPRARDGSMMNDYFGWTRSVSISPVDPVTLAPPGDAAADTGLRLIVVTVTTPTNEITEFKALRANSTELEQTPMLDTAYVWRVHMAMTVDGDSGGANAISVPILNHRPPSVLPEEPDGGDGGEGGGG